MTDDLVFVNGIHGETGDYLLPPLTVHDVFQIARGQPVDELMAELRWRHKQTKRDAEKTYAPRYGVEPRDLAQAGWGVIFATDAAPAVRDALTELLDHRREQATAREERRYREFVDADAYQTGESKDQFLKRFGTGPGPADPDHVPYYLLLVGDPATIPYGFEQDLSLQRAVGRVHFETPEEYARYARTVVAAETGPARPRRAVFFGPRHDKATELTSTYLVDALQKTVTWDGTQPPWGVQTFLAEQATKDRLGALLGGDQTPAFLFSASHGLGYDPGVPRQRTHQGALRCQDAAFAAVDVADRARLGGLIAFHYACFGAGTPKLDELGKEIAPAPFVAALPQRLLGHPNGGALAVVGNVQRTWGWSFIWGSAGPQLAVFTDTIKQLVDGYPVGAAVEWFDQRAADLSTTLETELKDIKFGKVPDERALAETWTAARDARGYAIVGDPAVRLPVGGTQAA